MSCHSTNFLDSHQKELCQLISKHTQADEILEDIIKKLGENVSNPFYRKFSNQRNPIEKIDLLFKMVIEKGEETCLEFIQILEKVEELEQFWSKNKQESSRQTVYADNNSFVDNRRITGGKAKGLTMRVEIPAYQHSQCDTGVRHIPPNKDIIATNNSTVVAAEFVGVIFDGNMDLSVSSVRGSSVPKPADSTFTPKGPSQHIITVNKMRLIKWLTPDAWILQHVNSKGVLTDRDYDTIKQIPNRESAVIELLDKILMGERPCCQFLHLLKTPEVNETYPELKEWIDSIELPGSAVHMEKGCVAASSVKDKLGFFRSNRSDLVSKVKNVLPIVDYLQTNGCHSEMAANVESEKTKQQQMRILLDSTTSTGAAEALFTALCEHEANVMKDLIVS